MLGMIISQASLTFRVLGSRSRHCGYFLKKIVIALVPTFIDGLKYTFIQMLGMITSQPSSTFRVPGLRLKSLWLFLENFVIALGPTFID